MEKLNNILYYIILLALFGVCAFFLHSRQLTVVFVIFLIFPVLSCVLAKYVSKKLSLTVTTDELWVEKDKETQLIFRFGNKSFFPIINCIIDFKTENKYYPNEIKNTLNLSVPSGKYTAKLPITPTLCGIMNIKIESVTVKDALNIWGFKCKNFNDHYFYVRPVPEKNIGSLSASELYSEDSLTSVKNVNGTQPDGIREYIQGDKLRNIHWKLSTKYSELLVKEFSDNNEEAAVLLPELYKPAIDSIIDTVYGTGLMLLNSNMPFTLAFAAAGSEQLAKYYINDENSLIDGIEKIYLAYPSDRDDISMLALRREYAGGGIIYIHGGSDNKAVTDIL